MIMRNSRQIKDDRRLLAARFPRCFVPKGHGHVKQPLKVGIHKDLIAAGLVDEAGHPLPAWRIRQVLHDYCTGRKYLAAQAAGGPRIDLDGEPCGEVRPEDAARSAAMLRESGWTRGPAVPAMAAE